MGFFTNYAKNAFRMSKSELDILKFVVSQVEDGLPFPKKPSILMDSLKVCWAPEMVFTNDSTFGMWTYMHVNSIFIRPDENGNMAYRIEQNATSLTDKEKAQVESMKNRKFYSEVLFRHIDTDHSKLNMAINLLEIDGHMTTTILHEMWHRNQFLSNPVHYFVSCLVTNLVDYEWACEQSWSIEHDVRVKVDNETLKSKLRNIYRPFYDYLGKLNKHNNPETGETEKEMLEKEMDELRSSNPSVDGLLKMTGL